MTGRRKGTPCACETDPCSCGSSKGKCIRTINNLSPDPNGDFFIEEGSGITITQTGDNSFEVSFDGTLPSNPLIYKGTVGSGGTVAVLPAADPDNIGWCYIAIEAATSPVTYEVGDVLISDGYTWQVVPSGDEIINIVTSWQATPDDQHVPSEKLVKDSLDGKVDKIITPIVGVYAHTSITQNEIRASINAGVNTVMLRNSAGRSEVKDVSADTDSDEIINVRTLNRRLTDGSVSKIGTVNVGSDTKPIKLVAGIPTAVTNDLVSTSGNQTIAGVKTLTSTPVITANSIIINNSGHKYLTAQDGSGNAISTIQFTSLGTINMIPGIAAGGIKAVTIQDQRAYNASNTSDVVNIALLDAYTPMVRTTGNQDISGNKYFLNTPVIKSNNIDRTNPPNTTAYMTQLAWLDKNGVELIRFIPTFTSTGEPHLYLVRYKTDGTSVTSELGV